MCSRTFYSPQRKVVKRKWTWEGNILLVNPRLGLWLAVGNWTNPASTQDRHFIHKLEEIISCPKASCKDNLRQWIKTQQCNLRENEHLTNRSFCSLLWSWLRWWGMGVMSHRSIFMEHKHGPRGILRGHLHRCFHHPSCLPSFCHGTINPSGQGG